MSHALARVLAQEFEGRNILSTAPSNPIEEVEGRQNSSKSHP